LLRHVAKPLDVTKHVTVWPAKMGETMSDQPPQNQSFMERLKAKQAEQAQTVVHVERAEVSFIERQEHHHHHAAPPTSGKERFLEGLGRDIAQGLEETFTIR
jgi:hypothetical protein